MLNSKQNLYEISIKELEKSLLSYSFQVILEFFLKKFNLKGRNEWGKVLEEVFRNQ